MTLNKHAVNVTGRIFIITMPENILLIGYTEMLALIKLVFVACKYGIHTFYNIYFYVKLL